MELFGFKISNDTVIIATFCGGVIIYFLKRLFYGYDRNDKNAFNDIKYIRDEIVKNSEFMKNMDSNMTTRFKEMRESIKEIFNRLNEAEKGIAFLNGKNSEESNHVSSSRQNKA